MAFELSACTLSLIRKQAQFGGGVPQAQPAVVLGEGSAAAKRWWPSGAYTLVFKLVALTVLFPWDNSCCERGFSCMNRIKCRMRASLGPVLLDQLMRISMCGPPLDSWDPRPAIAKWMAKKDRRVK